MPLRKAALPLAASLLFGACSHTPRLEQVPCPVSDEVLKCAAEPSAPTEDTDAAAGGYIADLREAGRDCRSKLQAVGETLSACQAPH